MKKRFEEIYDLIAIRCILDAQAMSMRCWDMSMTLETNEPFQGLYCRRKANGCTGLSILTTVKGPIEFRFVPRKCTRLLNYGLRLTGPTKRNQVRINSKESAIGMNWIKGWWVSRPGGWCKRICWYCQRKLSGWGDLCLYSRWSGSFSSRILDRLTLWNSLKVVKSNRCQG